MGVVWLDRGYESVGASALLFYLFVRILFVCLIGCFLFCLFVVFCLSAWFRFDLGFF